jgi:hypothetical protein
MFRSFKFTLALRFYLLLKWSGIYCDWKWLKFETIQQILLTVFHTELWEMRLEEAPCELVPRYRHFLRLPCLLFHTLFIGTRPWRYRYQAASYQNTLRHISDGNSISRIHLENSNFALKISVQRFRLRFWVTQTDALHDSRKIWSFIFWKKAK